MGSASSEEFATAAVYTINTVSKYLLKT